MKKIKLKEWLMVDRINTITIIICFCLFAGCKENRTFQDSFEKLPVYDDKNRQMILFYEKFDDIVLENIAAKDESIVSRLYALQILTKRNNLNRIKIVFNTISDTSKIRIKNNEKKSPKIYFDNVNNTQVNIITKQLTHKEKVLIDSFFIYNDNAINLTYFKTMFKTLPPLNKYYGIFRKKYSHGCFYALLMIAKYKKEADKVLIDDCLKNYENSQYNLYGHDTSFDIALEAVKIWPDKYFKKNIEIICEKKFNNKEYISFGKTTVLLIQVLLAYSSEWSEKLLREAIRNCRINHGDLDSQILCDIIDKERKTAHL